jgi:hypothetical protein
MTVNEILKVVPELKFTEIQAYLRNTGWIRIQTPNDRISLFHKTIGDLIFETILPLSKDFSDYSYRIIDVLEQIAQVEQRAVREVLTDLSITPADTVKFRVINRDTIDDFIGKISLTKADPDIHARREGEIILNFILGEEDKVSKARVILSNQDYNEACEAHKKGKSVKISGKLVTVGRSKVIETATFQIIH